MLKLPKPLYGVLSLTPDITSRWCFSQSFFPRDYPGFERHYIRGCRRCLSLFVMAFDVSCNGLVIWRTIRFLLPLKELLKVVYRHAALLAFLKELGTAVLWLCYSPSLHQEILQILPAEDSLGLPAIQIKIPEL